MEAYITILTGYEDCDAELLYDCAKYVVAVPCKLFRWFTTWASRTNFESRCDALASLDSHASVRIRGNLHPEVAGGDGSECTKVEGDGGEEAVVEGRGHNVALVIGAPLH